jgi:N-ethylmaleimide reductase
MASAHDPQIDLFSPIEVGPYTLPNRIVMAPMTRNRAGPGNAPRDLNVEYYRQRASAGLIIAEGSQISPQGMGYPDTPGIYSAEQVAGWKHITEAVHAKGGHIFLQLWHVGRISHPALQPGEALPVAPSAIKPAGEAMTYEGPRTFVEPRALELDEIHGIINDYLVAAKNAQDAGFDGIEIHGANGYLLDQFLRDGSNRRNDKYGGEIKNRVRLLLEVTEAVTSVWGEGRVGIRISPLQPYNDMYDSDPEALFSYLVQQLNNFKLAYLHVTEMGKESAGAAGPAFDLLKLRNIYRGVYITNAGYDQQRANAALAAGEADMVAFGVLFIANPDLPERFATNAPLNTPDPETFFGGNAKGYTDYPALAQHKETAVPG